MAKQQYQITPGTKFPASIGLDPACKTGGDISLFSGSSLVRNTLADMNAIDWELRKWYLTTCFVLDNSPAGNGSGTGQWYRLNKIIASDIMDAKNWIPEGASEEVLTASLPVFQANNTVDTTDAAYVTGQVVKYTIDSSIRLFEALSDMTGENNPVPTNATYWKEVSPAAVGAVPPMNIAYHREQTNAPFRHEEGEQVIYMLPSHGLNNPNSGSEGYTAMWQIYRRRVGCPYPGNVPVMPIDDYFGQYWDLVSDRDFSAQHEIVYNNTAGPIYSGMPVYITGSQLGPNNVRVWTVAPCNANDPAKMPAIGVVERRPGLAIPAGSYGRITQKGVLYMADVSASDPATWLVGETIYVADFAGGLTNVKPAGVVQEIGRVLDKTDYYSNRIILDIKPIASGNSEYKVLIQPIANVEEDIEKACTLTRVYFGATLTGLQIQINGGAIQTLTPVNRVWSGSIAIPAGAILKWIPTASTANTSWTYTTK